MRKEEWAAIILSAFLIFAPLIGGVVQNSLQATGDSCCGNYNSDHTVEMQGWLTILVATFTLVVVAFQAWISHWQRELMDRQTRIMERQTLMQTEVSRPHIVVVGIAAKTFEDTAFLLIEVVWRNSGQIPPTDFRTGVQTTVSRNRELPGLRYNGPLEGGPLISRDAQVTTDTFLLASGDPEDIWIFVYGKATYTDRLSPGVVHHVDYCFRAMKHHSGVEFSPYGPYNRAYDGKQPKHALPHNTPPSETEEVQPSAQ